MSEATRHAPEFVRAMGAVAREILGEPTEENTSKSELRFGTNGSFLVKLETGTWFDYEDSKGGGVLDFVQGRKGLDKDGAVAWLRDRGHLPKATPSFNIVARYAYTDADGQLLYEVCRFDPKNFRQRRPDGPGKWIWKMAGVNMVLYHLPDVIAAVQAGRVIYITEGEKSADALTSKGLTATCSPGGANKWRKDFAKDLVGADVVILPDNDVAGQSHGAMVAGSLQDKAKRIRVLNLPDLPAKGDVFDWIAGGGTAAEFAGLVATAPDFVPTVRVAPASSSSVATADDVVELKNRDITEDGIALAFTAAYTDKLRYCHHAQHWYVWAGTYWRRDETKLAFSWARQICRKIGRDADEEERARISKAAFSAAVERFAQTDRTFAVTAETWDCDPWLLGTPGGPVDLKTGILRQSDRNDHITKQTAVTPAPAGTLHPAWTEFLDQATNKDKELQAFLQRLVGYCLTGDVTEEVLAFLYGEGGTGKGTFLGAVVAVLGDYAVAVPIEVFTAGTRLNLEYYRAQMAGARLVTASETESGATWAESQIKEMTGNEAPLSGRHPYGKPFTFRPQFKIMLVGNHAPRLKGRSKAMERRMRITPFKNKPAKPDVGLKDRLRDEYPAILRWLIDGCLAWQENRLGTCDAVAAETGTYFEQQDHFGHWLSERCIVGGTTQERPSKLFTDFLVWAKECGEASVSSSEFRELVERTNGLRYAMIKGTQWVKGVGFKPSEGFQDRQRESF